MKSTASFILTVVVSFSVNISFANSLKPKPKPNVVIILTDDMGYGDISCFAQTKYKTPHIDKIASDGVKLTDFYVPTPYCAPSRATLLTGRFPLRHGLFRNPHPDGNPEADTIGISSKEILMSNMFKEAGYATKAIGKWHLGHQKKFFPLEHGFDEYYGILYSNDMRPVQIIQDRDTVQYPVDQRFLTSDYTEKAIDFIKRKKDSPFFLYLAHAMPHKPLSVSDRFYTPETPDDLYADVVRELDWSVGEVMKTLKELKLLDNTIVIFMSDNGPYYGGSSGGLKGMKATNWEGGIRVPFIIRYPKIFPKNTKIEVPAWSPDILPTLLKLTNITPSRINKFDGQDITKILKGKEINHPAVFSLSSEKIMSVRKGDYKIFVNNPYTRLQDSKTWVDDKAPDGITIIAQSKGQATPAQYPGVIPQNSKKMIQLYNLREDPTESKDLSEINKEKVNELMEEYRKFIKSLPLPASIKK